MLVAGLFVQGILAAHACVMSADDAVMVHAAESADGAMPCHESEKSNANACLMHCEQDNQLNVEQQTIAALPMIQAVLQIAMPQIHHKAVTPANSSVALNTGPPLSIRFCSFLI